MDLGEAGCRAVGTAVAFVKCRAVILVMGSMCVSVSVGVRGTVSDIVTNWVMLGKLLYQPIPWLSCL